MSEAIVSTGNSWRTKTMCWLLAVLTVAGALAGYAFSAFGRRIVAAAVLIAVSAFLAIGLCTVLLHQYDRRADKIGAILYGRILHGLMLHALAVAVAALMHAANASQKVIAFPIALADAALAATMVFLFADVRMNWSGADKTWVWAALVPGAAVFALCLFGVDWIVWLLIAVLAAAAAVVSVCNLEMRNKLCNLIFAFAVAVLAVILLLDGHAPKTQMILHILCLILTPVYALAILLRDETKQARIAKTSDSHCLRNGRTVIYRNAAKSPAQMMQTQKSNGMDTADDPQTKYDPELAAIKEKVLAWKAEEENDFDAEKLANEEIKTLPGSGMRARELNCDMAFAHAYRLLSLKYLSIAPLKAFSEISEAQIACLNAFGVHTVSQLAALPMCRVAAQIVLMASREEKKSVGD